MEKLISYEKIRSLVAINEHGSINLAAEAMGRSQSAISQQIQALERELSVKLLETRSKKVYFTREGEKLVHASKEPFTNIDNCILEITDDKFFSSRVLKLSYTRDNSTNFILSQHLGKYASKYKEIELQIKSAITNEILSAIKNNETDIGIVPEKADESFFTSIPLKSSSYSIVSSKKYLENTKKISSPRDLLELKLVDTDKNLPNILKWFELNDKASIKKLKKISTSLCITGLSPIKDIIKSGYGLALLPDYLIKNEIKRGEMIDVFPNKKKIVVQSYLIHKKSANLSLHEKKLIDYLLKCSQNT